MKYVPLTNVPTKPKYKIYGYGDEFLYETFDRKIAEGERLMDRKIKIVHVQK